MHIFWDYRHRNHRNTQEPRYIKPTVKNNNYPVNTDRCDPPRNMSGYRNDQLRGPQRKNQSWEAVKPDNNRPSPYGHGSPTHRKWCHFWRKTNRTLLWYFQTLAREEMQLRKAQLSETWTCNDGTRPKVLHGAGCRLVAAAANQAQAAVIASNSKKLFISVLFFYQVNHLIS